MITIGPAGSLQAPAEEAKKDKLLAECRALLAADKRVEAVKRYRSETGCSLPQAQRELGIK
jgi:ribosomal protein L7/L12